MLGEGRGKHSLVLFPLYYSPDQSRNREVISSFKNRILLTSYGELFTTIQNQMVHRKHCIPLCFSMRNKIVIHIQMQSSSVDGNMCLLFHIKMSFASTPNSC